MDAITLLTQEHQWLRGLLDALAAASEVDGRGALRRACAALRAHQGREEAVLYPAVRRLRSLSVRGAVRAALAEHQVIDGMLAELEQTDPEEAAFRERTERLRHAVFRHMHAEEDLLFGEARRGLAEERLLRLGGRIESLGDGPGRLRPRSGWPGSAAKETQDAEVVAVAGGAPARPSRVSNTDIT